MAEHKINAGETVTIWAHEGVISDSLEISVDGPARETPYEARKHWLKD